MRSIPLKLFYGLLYAAPVALLTLVACGGGGSSGGTPSPTTFTLAGNVLGLAGGGLLALQNTSAVPIADSAAISAPFTTGPLSGVAGFAFKDIPKNGEYNIVAEDSLTAPAQKCSVLAPASSSVMSADVTNMLVQCVDDVTLGPSDTVKIKGYVLNLNDTGLVLRNNGGDDLSFTPSNPPDPFYYFEFTPIAYGINYRVTVLYNPAAQTCAPLTGALDHGVALNGALVIFQCTTP